MKLTIVYDNEVCQAGLENAWGFACLVEENGRRLLFDTGGKGGVLLSNMEKLKVDPKSIQEIFISHNHWDHAGGLEDFLGVDPGVTLYLPASCPKPRGAAKIVSVQGSCSLSGDWYSTGELPNEEQSLVVKTDRGLLVLVGCSHPGVGEIFKAASRFGQVTALVGGLHGFKDFDLLAGLDLVCPCHCTKFQADIFTLYPKTTVRGGAGRVLEF